MGPGKGGAKRAVAPRKEPSQDRAKATVTALLDATRALLTERGYSALTTNHVAKRAGVSVGSLYQYFPSKDALVSELVEQHLGKLSAAFMTQFASALQQQGSVRDTVRAFVAATLHATRVDPRLYQVLSEQLPRVGKLGRVHELDAQFVQMLETAFAQDPKLRVPRPKLAAFVVVHAMKAVSIAALTDAPSDADALEEELVHMFAAYLTAARPVSD